MYTLVERHLSRVHLSRANFLYSHDLSDAQLTWNKVAYEPNCSLNSKPNGSSNAKPNCSLNAKCGTIYNDNNNNK